MRRSIGLTIGWPLTLAKCCTFPATAVRLLELDLVSYSTSCSATRACLEYVVLCTTYQPDLTVLQALLPAAEEFLKKYIYVWDGKLHQDVILGLLSFAPLTRFDGKNTSSP